MAVEARLCALEHSCFPPLYIRLAHHVVSIHIYDLASCSLDTYFTTRLEYHDVVLEGRAQNERSIKRLCYSGINERTS